MKTAKLRHRQIATPPKVVFPADVEEFCKIHDLRRHLETAAGLAANAFEPDTISFAKECDRETEGEWVTNRVVVVGKTGERVLASTTNTSTDL